MPILDDIKKDAKQMAAFLAYAKRSHILENVLFYFDKGNEEAVYKKYISEKSPTSVNIAGDVRTPLNKMAETKEWGKMKPLITKGKANVMKELEMDHLLPGKLFWKSKEYLEWHKKFGPKTVDPKAARASAVKALKVLGIDPEAPQLKKYYELVEKGENDKAASELTSANAAIQKDRKAKAAKNAPKAAKILGIKDVKTLTKAMELAAVGDKAGATKLLEKLAADEKMKEKADMIYKSLVASGLA